MLKELKEKYNQVIRSSNHMWANDSFSFYRLFIFITSYKGQKRIWTFFYKLVLYFFRKLFGLKKKESDLYALWMKKWGPTKQQLNSFKEEIAHFRIQPKISIIVFDDSGRSEVIAKSIHSVTTQIYQNWEVFGVLSTNFNEKQVEYLQHTFEKHSNIKLLTNYSEENRAEFNKQLGLETSGDFVLYLTSGDEISADALYQYIKTLQSIPETDLMYADEDIIDSDGNRTQPFFKPDWSPDSFLSQNYIGNCALIKKSLIDKTASGLICCDTNELYDLLLNISEVTSNIIHVPTILYHKRNTKSDRNKSDSIGVNKNIESINKALARRGIEGRAAVVENNHEIYSVRYKITHPGKVSIIIPSKNKTDLCSVAVRSVFELTDYPDFEIILIDNNSDEPEFFEFVKYWEENEPHRFRYYKDSGVFNFSRLINYGVSVSKGIYYLLLNNDIEVTHTDWLSAMVEQCQFKTTGAVGAKLIYKNDTVQHAGVIIGLGGIAGHAFVGLDRNDNGYFNYLKCITNYSAVTAACLMIRKEVFDEVAGFDEHLAVDFNDIDFCLKIKDRGYHNMYLPHVVVYHYESVSRGHPLKSRKSHRQHQSDVSFFKSRWQKYIDHDPCYNPHLTRIFTDFRLGIKD